jgi:F-type H+-transporting ATPase subunit delta
MLSVVSTRYAGALVDVVAAPGSKYDAAGVLKELHSVEQVIAESPSLRVALLSPAVPPGRKRAVISRLLQPLGVSQAVRNFMFVVIDHRRVGDFGSIVEAFETLLDERLGFVQAQVASAQPLTVAQQAALEAQLTRVAGKKAKLKFSTDPDLVAGVVARVGSVVYDGSVRGQLDRLRTKLGRG